MYKCPKCGKTFVGPGAHPVYCGKGNKQIEVVAVCKNCGEQVSFWGKTRKQIDKVIEKEWSGLCSKCTPIDPTPKP